MRKFRKLLLGLLAKFGGKLLAVAIKLVKALKVGKVALAGLSFAAYASMTPERMTRVVLSTVQRTPKLLECAWARAGKVKAYKQGGRWLIHRQSLGNYALRLVADSRATEIEPDSKGYGLGYMQGRGAS